jgi:hypothetical protein
MRTTKNAFILAIAFAALGATATFAERPSNRGKIVSRGEDGSVCYELDVKEAEEAIGNAEAAEKAGRLKEAFDAAKNPPGCMPDNGYERMFGIIERTYKKLGQEAEKAGRLMEAHEYYIYPFKQYFSTGTYRDHEKNYSFADADRVMLNYAKANPDNYEVVLNVTRYFESREGRPNLEEVHALAMRGGDRMLAKEEKDFAGRKYEAALDDLKKAKEWFGLANDEQPADARAKKRCEALLAEGSYNSVERAFDYIYDFQGVKLETARARAGKLGDEAEQRGDYPLAERFYSLAGEDVKQDALVVKMTTIREQKERQQAQAEAKRQEQFKKDQKSLEEELGF